MKTHKIFKTKFYLVRLLHDDPIDEHKLTGFLVEAWRGSFRTESEAYNEMYETDPKYLPQRVQRRKAEYAQAKYTPVKGTRILKLEYPIRWYKQVHKPGP